MVQFVTCLFDLKPHDNYNLRRPISDYLKSGDLLLKSNICITLFIDKSLVQMFNEHIKSIELKCHLEMIAISIESLPLWNERQKFKQAVRPNLSNERFTAEYFILMWSKFFFVKSAIEIHPNLDYFVWIDFGISHVNNEEDFKLLEDFQPSKGFKICKYWTSQYPLCADRDYILGTVWSQTPAGLFSASIDSFKKVEALFDQISKELLDSGRVAVDEDILTYIRSKNSELFDCFYGTYSTLIRSFHGEFTCNEWNLTQNLENLKNSTRISDQSEAFDLANLALSHIIKGKFSVSNTCFNLITGIICKKKINEEK